MYSLTVLEARKLKLRCEQDYTSSRAQGELLFLDFQLLEVAGIPWLVVASLQSLPLWSHSLILFFGCLILCAFVLWGHAIAFRAHLDNHRQASLIMILNLHRQKTFLQIRSHSQFPGIRIWTKLLGGYHPAYCTLYCVAFKEISHASSYLIILINLWSWSLKTVIQLWFLLPTLISRYNFHSYGLSRLVFVLSGQRQLLSCWPSSSSSAPSP